MFEAIDTGGFELHWHGPFDLVPGGSLPLATEQAVAGSPGIYLWTVELLDGYLVNYVGQTARSFAVRLEEEIGYEMGRNVSWDVATFARGERHPLPPLGNPEEQRRNLREMLEVCRIFMAPVKSDPETLSQMLKQIESCLISHLKSLDERCKSFLGNGPAYPTMKLDLKMVMPENVRLIGLDVPMASSHAETQANSGGPGGGDVVIPETDAAFIDTFVAERRWQFAKTYADTAPHEYTIRDWKPEKASQDHFDRFIQLIRQHGVTEKFWGKPNAYLYIGDWKYWTMGAPINETVVINRADANGELYGPQ